MLTDIENDELADIRKYLEDRWDMPVVATTFVRFSETLFSSGGSNVRRFQSLCNSVIIVDEVQSVPTKIISLFNSAINFLSKLCGCTVILCSATQPCLDKAEHRLIVNGDIIDDTVFKRHAEIFKRNKIIDAGNFPLKNIPDFIADKAAEYRSVLVVCNKKSQAQYLFEALKSRVQNYRHLSAGMCPVHRKDVLKDIKYLLSAKEPVVCVSTQVIEAGVDISFECAVRFSAGADSIAQTAGRCNRNGEFGSCAPVFAVECSDEDLTKLPDIQTAKCAAKVLFHEFKNSPTRFSNDLCSFEAIEYYYKYLFSLYPKGHFDGQIKNMRPLYEMLSDNPHYRAGNKSEYTLCQSFKTAGSRFCVFESPTVTVLVPYGDGKDIPDRLQQLYYDKNYKSLQNEIKNSAQFSVSVFDYQFNLLTENNAILPLCDGAFYVLSPSYYGPDTGFTGKPKEENPCDILIL